MNGESWQINDIDEIKPVTEAYFNIIGEEYYRADAIRDAIRKQFDVTALFRHRGRRRFTAAETALGSLLLYLLDIRKTTSHI
ncbi:MAG: hypothetical protein V8Q42_03850 [Anaerovoracaceae bacterium]